VGGDFYDVIDLDSEHVGIFIGDVSDKGMPAALYMALTRSLVIAEARKERSPGKILFNINQLLMEIGEPRQFVSLFFGIIQKKSRCLTYSRAGHEYPIWIHEGSLQHLTGEGTILGVLENEELFFSEEQALLSSGDRIVLYTDGLTDAMNRHGVTFDLGSLERLALSLALQPADKICSTVFEKVLAHQQDTDQFDDMTMLVVEIE
jgi:phosphoserine phosphatase RsbU/P